MTTDPASRRQRPAARVRRRHLPLVSAGPDIRTLRRVHLLARHRPRGLGPPRSPIASSCVQVARGRAPHRSSTARSRRSRIPRRWFRRDGCRCRPPHAAQITGVSRPIAPVLGRRRTPPWGPRNGRRGSARSRSHRHRPRVASCRHHPSSTTAGSPHRRRRLRTRGRGVRLWHPGCPVDIADLRYVTVTHWGFDEPPRSAQHRRPVVMTAREQPLVDAPHVGGPPR
jgi:hypothetical protein